MNASQIRTEGITAPGNSYCGGPNDHGAIAQNIGILCGIGLEIAAQLAEINQISFVEFKTEVKPHSIWVNPKSVASVTPHAKGGTCISLIGDDDSTFFHVQDEPHSVVKRLEAGR